MGRKNLLLLTICTEDEVIYSAEIGNVGRFANHSFNSNSSYKQRHIADTKFVSGLIMTTSTIATREEVTADYEWVAEEGYAEVS